MADIKASDVAALRAKTGCGMMDCKTALVASNGDFDEAVKYLREKGLSVAAKKADRIAAEGIVDILVDGGKAAIIEVNTETDFVAKNDGFRAFVKDLLKTVLATRPVDVASLSTQKLAGGSQTVAESLTENIFKIGEKISIRRFTVVEGVFSTYIHGLGVAGVIVSFDAPPTVTSKPEFAEMSKNVALQVASGYAAQYVNRSDVPTARVDEEKAILLAQIANDPANAKKPQSILEKMVEGRLGKFYQGICLSEQSYIRDDSLTVGKYVEGVAKSLGTQIAIKSFVIYEKGEGIAKREDNLAEEVAKLTGNK